MRQILLIFVVMLMGCQRLRLEVDDLRLRCGEDASLDDFDQWIEIATDYGKPSPSSITATMISGKMQTKKLSISSRGCVGKPKSFADHQWLSIRVEQAGIFGKVVRMDKPSPWRLQLARIPDVAARIDCAKQETIGILNVNNQYSFSIKLPDDANVENFFFEANAFERGSATPILNDFTLSKIERGSALLDLQSLKEGQYQIELHIYDLLNFQREGIRTSSRKCNVAVDRTPPLVQLLGRNESNPTNRTITTSPGQAIEFKVEDRTNVQMFSCLMQKSEPGVSCRDYEETGQKITAPSEGEWVLSVYSTDAAGNRSPAQEYIVAVFDSEKLRSIAGWLDEAKLYINQKDYLRSVYRLASALHGFNRLKTDAEKSSIRAKIIAPLLQVLKKNVPFTRFSSEGVNIDAVFAMEADRIAVISGSIFRAAETQIKLMRVSGEVLKSQHFGEKVSIFHNAIHHRLLVIYAGGTYKILDASLNVVEQGDGSKYPADDFGRVPAAGSEAGHTFIYSYKDATYALDLATAEVTKIANGLADIAVSSSGNWASLRVDQEHFIYNIVTKQVKPFKLGFEMKKIAMAHAADYICYMGGKDLLCGSFSDLYESKVHFQNTLAGKAFGISSDGNRVGYAGPEGVYFLDRKAGTHSKKTFQGPVIQIFFDQNDTMIVDTIIGRKAWDDLYEGMDGSSTDQLPPLVNDQYWFPRTSIFVKKIEKNVEFYLPDVQGKVRKISAELDLSRALRFVQTLDREFMVVVSQKELEVISLNVQLGDGFKQPCNRLSYDGDYCALAGSGSLKIGRKVAEKGYLDYEMLEVPHSPEWREIVWNDVQSNRFAVYHSSEIGIGKMQAGKVLIERRIPAGSFMTVKWLGGRYLAWVDDTLKIYDSVKGDYIGDFSGKTAYSLFNPPVDYSPELSVVAAVVQNEEGDLELKLLRPQDGEEVGSWKFNKKGREEADLVKFSEDGLTLLLGFHDGTVQILESAQIREQNFEPKVIAQHADSVIGGDFMKTDYTAYTLSMDGAVVFHSDTRKEAPFLQGAATYPADDSILYTGVLKSENLIWVSNTGSLQIFDPARRSFDEVLGGKAYFRNNFLMAHRNQDESYLIDIVKLKYLKILCDWLMPSIRFGIFKNEESSSVCL